MEQMVTFLMDFWSQFLEDKPDIMRLYNIGNKLFPIKILVDEIWKKISNSKGDQLPRILRIYSKYVIEIFNDRKSCLELLDKAAWIERQNQLKKNFHVGGASDLVIDGQEDCFLFITVEEDNVG